MTPSDESDASREEMLDRVYRRGRVLRWRRRARHAATALAAVAAVAIPVSLASGGNPHRTNLNVVDQPTSTTVAPSSLTTTTSSAVPTTAQTTSTTVAAPATTTTTDTGTKGAPGPNQPLTITIRSQPSSPSSGQTVTFKSTADDPDALIECIAVDFGDGASTGAPCAPPSCGENPAWGPVTGHKDRIDQHAFSAPGTYTIHVTAYSGPCQSQFASASETTVVMTVQ